MFGPPTFDPAADRPPRGARPDAPPPPPPPLAPLAPRLVLVVDDAAADRDLHCLLLRTLGLHAVAAADGWEALVCARTLLPALVVTDLRMPHLGGRELLGHLRAAPETARIPVLVVSGDADELSAARGPVVGCAGVLTKPVDARAFREAVGALLGGGGPA